MSTYHNPFVGLRAFESDESLLFFGRQQQTLELLQHLHEHHFVAIIGSSGSGKSSLIRAGLIPGLKAGYLIEERDKWLLTIMKPGQSPLYNMAKGIACEVDGNSDEAAVQALATLITEEGADGVIQYLEPVIVNNTNIFLLVDQFEELFRFSADNQSPEKKNEAIDFVNILLDLTQQSSQPVYVVITMRSDFIGDCAQFYGLPEAMNKSQYLVPRLTRSQLKNVITGPLSVNAAGIEQSLLNQLLNDTGDNPDQLPVLQHALMRTWEVWKDKGVNRPLSSDDYKETGTMRSALSRHAEEAYAELGSERLQHICELLFKALTDKKSNARGVRRPQPFATLLLITGAAEEELATVINAFRTGGRTFLMPPVNIELSSKTVIDISHESLMRVWTRLVQWVDEEYESEQVYLRLSEAAQLYSKQRGGLWRNPELDIALQWKEKNNPNAAWASQINGSFEEAMAFLETSYRKAEQEVIEKEAEQKKRLRRTRLVAVVIGVIALVSIVLMMFANEKEKEAAESEKKAKRSAAAMAVANQGVQVANIKMVTALKNAEDNKAKAERLADTAFQQKQKADSLFQETTILLQNELKTKQDLLKADQNIRSNQAKLDSTNKSLIRSEQRAVFSQKQAIQGKNTADSLAGLSSSLSYARNAISTMAENRKSVTPGLLILKAYELNRDNKGPVQNSVIFDALTRFWMDSIHYANHYPSRVVRQPVRCLVVIPGTNLIISGSEDGSIEVINNNDGILTQKKFINVKHDIRSLAVSADSRKLVALSAEGIVYLFKISPSCSLTAMSSFPLGGTGKKILFENNRNLLALTSGGLFELKASDSSLTGSRLLHADDYTAFCIGSKGTLFIARHSCNILVYRNSADLAAGLQSKTIQAFGDEGDYITSLAGDETESYLLTGSYHGFVNVFTGEKTSVLFYTKEHQSAINDLAFATVNGSIRQVASAGADQTVKLRDITSADNSRKLRKEDQSLYLLTMPGHSKWVYGVAYSSNRDYVFSCGEDGKLIAWHTSMSDLYDIISKYSFLKDRTQYKNLIY